MTTAEGPQDVSRPDVSDGPDSGDGGAAPATDVREGQTRLFGVPMQRITRREALEAIDARIERGRPGYVVTPNVNHVCIYQRDVDFRAAYEGAFLQLPDGVPLMWAAKLLGKPLAEKVSGSDLLFWLTEQCAARGRSVFLFGGKEGVAERAAQRLVERYPGLRIAGVYCPPMGFHDKESEVHRALEATQRARPDVCLVALGAPKQELWMRRFSDSCGAAIMLGVGGSFDFAAGEVRRAPVWVQRAGLEWVWRLCREPRRLWRRYLSDGWVFSKLVVREFWRGDSPLADSQSR